MTDQVKFEVRGMAPAPQGSKESYGNGRFGEVSPYLRDWRALVATTAALSKVPLTEGMVFAEFEFIFPRPKSHYVGSKPGPDRLKPTAPILHATTPDLSKILRSTEDALTNIAYQDDRMIAQIVAHKRYSNWGELPGVIISITPAD